MVSSRSPYPPSCLACLPILDVLAVTVSTVSPRASLDSPCSYHPSSIPFVPISYPPPRTVPFKPPPALNSSDCQKPKTQAAPCRRGTPSAAPPNLVPCPKTPLAPSDEASICLERLQQTDGRPQRMQGAAALSRPRPKSISHELCNDLHGHLRRQRFQEPCRPRRVFLRTSTPVSVCSTRMRLFAVMILVTSTHQAGIKICKDTAGSASSRASVSRASLCQ